MDEFDILFLINATGEMSIWIKVAKDEIINISEQLRKEYPENHFKYGYIFYRDPIGFKEDIHEFIDLTDNINFLIEKIGKIKVNERRGFADDWAGAYKIANEKISWRKGIKIILHITDSGAHGQLFTKYDKYLEEEGKLIEELEKCALKGIKIFGYILKEDCRNSFEECSKIYRSKGGSFEISNFFPPEMMEKNPNIENSMINEHSKMRDNQIEMMNSNYNAMGIINEIGMNPMNMMNSFNNMMMSPITMVNSLPNQMIKPPPEALLYRMNFSMDNQNMINPNFINNELFK